MPRRPDWDPAPVIDWMAREGRLLGGAAPFTDALGRELLKVGAPVWRIRFAPRFANPLLRARGIIWVRSEGAREYSVPHGTELTDTYVGSPFEYVIDTRRHIRRKLADLKAEDHRAYHDVAEAGGSDFMAMPLVFSDGTVQAMSIATDDPAGFAEADIEKFLALSWHFAPLAEMISLRWSLRSLLQVYLGQGPSREVLRGAIRRGDARRIKAVVLMTDMKGFTKRSQIWDEDALLDALNLYFEAVVTAVGEAGGDVLKFVGDGILGVFPVDDDSTVPERCRAAVAAVGAARETLAGINERRPELWLDGPLDFRAALHVGPVVYGNIGSAERLDFTVIGPAVNTASRLESLCRSLKHPVLATAAVARHVAEVAESLGEQALPGIAGPVEIFALAPECDATSQ